MTSDLLFFSGAVLTLSVFNTLLLLWLGFTVLLNAARPNLSLRLAGAGLLAGGVFFIAHTAAVIQDTTAAEAARGIAWHVGWLALVVTPAAWYGAILSHMGYWEKPATRLHREHYPLVVLTKVTAVALAGLAVFARPVPSELQLISLYFASTPTVAGLPLLPLLYPLFVLLCTGGALLALRHPEPEAEGPQAPARVRARPWLVYSALALFAVGVFVAILLVWMVSYAGRNSLAIMREQPLLEAYWLDCAISLLISMAIVMIGESVVAYEIFMGRILPRQGLRRQWHNALVIAGGYSLAGGAGFALQFSLTYLTYIILFATVFLALAYALVSWSTYTEHERYLRQLRPFVTSEHVFEALLSAAPAAAGRAAPFEALCRVVLGAARAYLLPAGSLTALVPSPLVYPEGETPELEGAELLAQGASPETVCLPLDPARYAGAVWAVPLWSARGMIGLFLLGEKRDGGLYAQEEMEIARASGERLLDTMASATLAQRLMALQRQRFTESQVLDQRSRRTLHDDILPALHAAMLQLSGRGENAEALAQLGEVHRQVSALLREMPTGLASQVSTRGLLPALRQMVEQELASAFDTVTWEVEPEAEAQAHTIPALTADVVFYAAKEAIRNAARHGRGGEATRPLHLTVAARWHHGLELRLSDDGVGRTASAPAIPTSGQGLALHSTLMTVIGGSLLSESLPDRGATVTLFLPEERVDARQK